MKTRTRICLMLVCAILFVMMLPSNVFATGLVPENKPSSLSIVYKDNETSLEGAVFNLYQVAKITGSGYYSLTDDFANFPISVEDITAENIQSLSVTLESYVGLYDVAPLKTDATSSLGRIEFIDLEPGLYLVTGDSYTFNGQVYTTEPFLVFLPVTDSDGNWEYDVTASPKFSSRPLEETTELKVIKVWNDSDNEEERPKEITVYLLKDGEKFDSVILSSENNWRYSWTDLDSGHTWSIAEDVPKGYTVEITRNGTTYTCTNTKPTPPPPPPPKLPQTGQLWWPVPVLAAAGLVLIAIGLIIRRGTRYEA